MYIPRVLEKKIQESLFKGDILVIYGARQVGKTTMINRLLKNNTNLVQKYLNCDEGDIRRELIEADTSTALKRLIGDSQLVVIDEAQRIPDIGLKLKLMADNFRNQQIIATGSSSFDLANRIKEPLTGRSREFWLYPLSVEEMGEGLTDLEFERELENLLVYGSYPAVYSAVSAGEKKIQLTKIVSYYLYKDILKFENIRNPEILRKLLEALALQIGNEVSYNELASLLGLSRQTVQNYIQILEKAYVIFKITPFNRNLRKEIGKLRKIYFFDLGVRNAVIDSLRPLNLRNDTGALWENFVISEMAKRFYFADDLKKLYFWRTYQGAEVDLIEEKDGIIHAYEIKWDKLKEKPPKPWRDAYPNSIWHPVTRKNFFGVIKSS